MESTPRPGGRSLGGRSSFEPSYSGGLNKGVPGVGNLSNFKSVSRQSAPSSSSSIKGSSELDLKVGYMVEHDRFGKGKVTQMVGEGQDKKATIFFPHHGAKTVLLRFANLTVLAD
jgi:DNA helicase-2/ATP-dependent DNA helicase PcrA